MSGGAVTDGWLVRDEEIMAEGTVKPKSRSRKPQPASLSMFEWALSVELEREAEPVGAGR